MNTAIRSAAGAAVAMLGVACADLGTPAGDVIGAVAAFESVPAGFSSTSSSFDPSGDLGDAFHPKRGDGTFEDRRPGDKRPEVRRPGGDHRRRDHFGFLMGGGLSPEFFGLLRFGADKRGGPFAQDSVGNSCVFASSTGIVTCGPITKRGLTILVTAAIKNAAGEAQPKVDSLTNSVRALSEVRGTITRRDSAQSVLNHTSTRIVTGLARGSTQRTVDGTSVGTETTTGVTDAGAFEAIRTVNDTTAGIIIPVTNDRPTYPIAGRVSRNMKVVVTVEGTTTTHARSEVITYDGTATATVVITQDGVTKNCTLALPHGKLICQ
jgi:hypothetical protein